MSVIFFDLETQNLSFDVGGWHNIEAVRLAVACTWDEEQGPRTWWEPQAVDLLNTLASFDLIVGFNTTKFDFRVMAFYSDVANYLSEQNFDILLEIQLQGYPLVGLDDLAKINLGEQKTLKSGSAVDLWREGSVRSLALLETYCANDVQLTRHLTEFWEDRGVIWLDAVQASYALWPGLRPTSLAAAGLFGDRD